MSGHVANGGEKQPPRPSRLKDRIKRCWIVFGRLGGLGAIAMLTIVGLDLAFGMWPKTDFSGDLQSIPYYQSQPWTRRFEADQNGIASAKVEYRPYTVWRRPPYASGTVNVDADSLRVVPGSTSEEGVPLIFFFGGSTMWGTNSPDEGTIPALFLRKVRPIIGDRISVRNFGESAWVSTQSVIALINAIQRKEIPDLVIFYEGANDLNWTFGNDSPYRHAGYEPIAATFSGRGRGQGRHRAVDLGGVLRALAPNIATALDRRRQLGNGPSDRSPQGIDRLANQAMDVYFANLQMVRALAREYGFRCHFFWQPFLIYDRKPLADGESIILDRANSWAESFRPFAASANARVKVATNQVSDFSDLSGLFATTEEQIYTDMVHVTPQGNALVADAMAETLGNTLKELGKNH